MRARFLIVLMSFVFPTGDIHAAEFFGIGRGNYDDVQFEKLSGSGTAIVGRLVNFAGASSEIEPFRWTKETGIVSLGQLPDATARGALVTDVSFDGNVVAGFTATSRTRGTAFVWSPEAGLTRIGDDQVIGNVFFFDADLSSDGKNLVIVAPGFSSWSADQGLTEFSLPAGMGELNSVELSSSGLAAVGGSDVGSFYWTADDGVRLLSELTGSSLAVTNVLIQNRRPLFNDGSGIIGVGDDGTVLQWTEEGGLNELGWISPDQEPRATHVSDDGTIVAGSYEDRFHEDIPWIWMQDQGIQALELPAGVNALAPRNITPDGQTILLSESRFGGPGGDSFIWSRRDGLRHLATVFADEHDLGDALDGWALTVPWGISDDGSVFAGEGINPQGEEEIWIAILRDTLIGDFDGNELVDFADIDLLSEQVRLGSNDPVFDLNADDIVDELDRVTWVEELAGTFFGDANLDQRVEFADFVLLADHFGEEGGWGLGDFDGSGDVQFEDFLMLSNNFGQSAVTAASVSEPSDWNLVGGLILCLAPFCRSRIITGL